MSFYRLAGKGTTAANRGPRQASVPSCPIKRSIVASTPDGHILAEQGPVRGAWAAVISTEAIGLGGSVVRARPRDCCRAHDRSPVGYGRSDMDLDR